MPAYLTIPINEEGYTAYDYGIESPENCIQYILSDEEVETLIKNKVFSSINISQGLSIARFEDEKISPSQLKATMHIINSVPGAFCQAAKRAIDLNQTLFVDLL